ncbi:MAG: hypothetical protein A3C58_02685 [Candidatus Staskawiczbacteria bacterium RIFCSPHIGHO2_02_FULL_34_10]|uniref:HIT domain-containing protein n=1 Tax=Candidatus Staskawiczbacteria bacterium RIFCSPHIGHO2_02_FULL_34_10 TaxID=1802205 RepID=A0A1G2HVU9_9BACT|nr:MAG: hypothetical protein A3C58_02685 [Candidatus Staskawiczbacteria bacterium RIFCSPHIGHO2_02_FULL_34_10]
MKTENKENLFSELCSCGCFNSFKNQDIDFIKDFRHWFLILNYEQGFLGRCLLILKKHKTDEMELTYEEVLEKHKIYCIWRKAVTKAFNPDKINQAQLGNEEHVHKGHLHWHFVPRYRRPMFFVGVEFQSDTPETQKLIFSAVHKRLIYPLELRVRIKEELLKHL